MGGDRQVFIYAIKIQLTSNRKHTRWPEDRQKYINEGPFLLWTTPWILTSLISRLEFYLLSF